MSSFPLLAQANTPFPQPSEILDSEKKLELPAVKGAPPSPGDFDLSRYTLTPADIRSMEWLIGTGEYDITMLDRFAKSYEKAVREKRPWVPPHNTEEVEAVSQWAEGAAFSTYAKKAGYAFDAKTYNEDCPYRILFNYGYATAYKFRGRDIITSTINTMTDLQFKFQKGDVDFPTYFYEQAVKKGFDKYLTKLE